MTFRHKIENHCNNTWALALRDFRLWFKLTLTALACFRFRSTNLSLSLAIKMNIYAPCHRHKYVDIRTHNICSIWPTHPPCHSSKRIDYCECGAAAEGEIVEFAEHLAPRASFVMERRNTRALVIYHIYLGYAHTIAQAARLYRLHVHRCKGSGP